MYRFGETESWGIKKNSNRRRSWKGGDRLGCSDALNCQGKYELRMCWVL